MGARPFGASKMNKRERKKWELRLRETDGESLVSALMGCSMELSLCDEVEWEPGLLTKKELQEEEAMILAELKFRVANGDPDVLAAREEKTALWAQIQAVVKRTN